MPGTEVQKVFMSGQAARCPQLAGGEMQSTASHSSYSTGDWMLSDVASPPTPQPEERQLTLPEMLPPNYEVLRDENGITEAQPPKSCPIFRDERDPEGRLRHLAGLILH